MIRIDKEEAKEILQEEWHDNYLGNCEWRALYVGGKLVAVCGVEEYSELYFIKGLKVR